MWSAVHGIELLCVSALLVWGAHRLSFLLGFLALERHRDEAQHPDSCDDSFPAVVVQLPLYNERHVVERLIRAAGELNWPRDRFEIQVLDDSDDETFEVAAVEVERLRSLGINATHLRRETRDGFKAGALAFGMAHSEAQVVAVFDADFVPAADFLERTVPRLTAACSSSDSLMSAAPIGMVQARWGHLNRDESLLTRAQATLLDGHFAIEHRVRAARELYFNFNGTAGVWWRSAIDAGGGWQADTLTEDLDLSYRSQLAGVKFHYADEIETPAELPSDIAAFKSQQHRWAQGSAQVLRKLARRIALAPGPVVRKLEAFAHLGGNVGYPLVLTLVVLLPISLADPNGRDRLWHLLLFVGCVGSTALFYERCQNAQGRGIARRVIDSFAAIALGIGISASQTRAVAAGFMNRHSAFQRTPKKGERNAAVGYTSGRGLTPGIELLLAGWVAMAGAIAIANERFLALPLVALLFAGFAWVGVLSLARRFD